MYGIGIISYLLKCYHIVHVVVFVFLENLCQLALNSGIAIIKCYKLCILVVSPVFIVNNPFDVINHSPFPFPLH